MKLKLTYIIFLFLISSAESYAQYYALKVVYQGATKVYPLIDSVKMNFSGLQPGIEIKMYVDYEDKEQEEYIIKEISSIDFREYKDEFDLTIPEMTIRFYNAPPKIITLSETTKISFNTYLGADDDAISSIELVNIKTYPNPFSDDVTIRFTLKTAKSIDIQIDNIEGKNIYKFKSRIFPDGESSVIWNGKDNSGASAPPGVYVCLAKAEGNIIAKKVIKIE